MHSNSLHSWYGWAAARVLGRPHVVHAREIVVQSRAALGVERALCRHFATRVVAVSYAVAAQLDPANVVVLDEYLDPDEFSPMRAGTFRSRAGLADDALVVGAVARLDPLKGLDVLLDAHASARAERPELQLVIVGSPVLGQETYAAELQERVAAAPGAQLLEGRDDIPDVMADLDVLAFPSVEPESYGLVLVEALASGTPVVGDRPRGPARDRGPGEARRRAGRPSRRRRGARHGTARAAPQAHDARTAPRPPPRVHTPAPALRRAVPGSQPASLWVTGSSPIHSRSVFFSLVCWMKMSCSGGSAASAVCGALK